MEASSSKVRTSMCDFLSCAATAISFSTQAHRPPSHCVGASYPPHTPVVSRRIPRLAPKSSTTQTSHGAPHASLHAVRFARTHRRRRRGGHGCRRTGTYSVVKIAQEKRENRWRGRGSTSEEEEERYGVSEEVEEDQGCLVAFRVLPLTPYWRHRLLYIDRITPVQPEPLTSREKVVQATEGG